ncbi:putative low-specificity L-threonine aldolase 1 [Porites harrisoni]
MLSLLSGKKLALQLFPKVSAVSRLRYFASLYTSGGVFDDKKMEGRVIDLRSDTVTVPTEEMRAAMAAAEVGDDVYGDDPTVNALQAKAAELTGKEAALFITSGTMGNLVSVMAHCSGRGDELFVGDIAHITIWEQGGVAQIAGVHPRQVHTNPDGTLDLLEIESKVRSREDAHQPISRLICVEQTHNGTGGRVLSLEYLQRVKELAVKLGLRVHMDGARLFNAATALGVPVAQVTQHVDSVTFCLSKALGAPVGSIVAGNKELISRCWRHRKVLGGGMRQAGVLAAAGIYALDHIAPKLHEDHANAQILAKGIYEMKDLGLEIDLQSVESNMVYFNINHPRVSGDELVKRMLDITDSEPVETRVAVRMLAYDKTRLRLVLHHQVTEDDVHKALQKLRFILTSF